MATPDKVILEITPHGWLWQVYAGEKVVAAHRMKLVSRGNAKGCQKGSLPDKFDEDYPDFAEALEDENPFDICNVLADMQ